MTKGKRLHMNSKTLIIIGASGHGKVIADIAIACGYKIKGFLDDDKSKKECYGYQVLGGTDAIDEFSDCVFIIAIGSNKIRKDIVKKHENLKFAVLIHPSAMVSPTVQIKEGTVIMPKVVINAATTIGSHSIINTASVVEHDCEVGNYVHVSPNATICGTCRIGDSVWIGAGSTVINNIKIVSDAIIGAGTVVVKDVVEKGTYVGVPVRRI